MYNLVPGWKAALPGQDITLLYLNTCYIYYGDAMQEVKPKNDFLSYIIMTILCAGVGAISGGIGGGQTIVGYTLLGAFMALALPVINIVTLHLKHFAVTVSAVAGAAFGLAGGVLVMLVSPESFHDLSYGWLILSSICYGALIHMAYALRRKLVLVYIELLFLIYLAATFSFMIKFSQFFSFWEGLMLTARSGLSLSLLFSAGWFTTVYMFDPCYFKLRRKGKRARIRVFILSIILPVLFIAGLPKLFHLQFRYDDLVFRSANNNRAMLDDLPEKTELYAGYKKITITPRGIHRREFPLKYVLAYSMSNEHLAARTSVFKEVSLFERMELSLAKHILESGSYLLMFSPDGDSLATYENNHIAIYDAISGKEQRHINLKFPINNMCWTADGSKMVLEDVNNKLILLELESGKTEIIGEGIEPLLMTSGNIAYYWNGRILKRMPEADSIEEVIYDLPVLRHELLFDFCLSPDEKYICYLYPHNNMSIGTSYVVVAELGSEEPGCVIGIVPQANWDLDIYWVESLKSDKHKQK